MVPEPDSEESIPPEPPELLKKLKWIQLNWRRHWKLLAIVGVVVVAPYLYRWLSPELPEVVTNAVAALNSSDPDARIEAVEDLGDFQHPDALEALHDALKHPDRDVRCYAATILGDIGDPSSFAPLLDVLEGDDQGCHSRVLWALSAYNCRAHSSCTVIERSLQHPNDFTRAGAILAIGNVGDETGIQVLIDALDDSLEVRGTAIRCLASLGQEGTAALLSGDPPADPNARRAMAAVFGLVRDERGILRDPRSAAGRLRTFVGGDLDLAAMAAAVDPTLHRTLASR